ncbi:hypothetical protein QE152_g39838 [Popillia japonica]|uniref:Uncharacterized protein n=1 Tax=Popillia japonica TaxID=7064 RepID=A0AAW1HSW4_POPJA
MGYIISNVGGQNGGERAKEKYSVFSVVSEPSSITYSNPIHQDARLTSAPSSEISTKDDQFKRQVLKNLSILNFKLDQIMDDISRLNVVKKFPKIYRSLYSKS